LDGHVLLQAGAPDFGGCIMRRLATLGFWLLIVGLAFADKSLAPGSAANGAQGDRGSQGNQNDQGEWTRFRSRCPCARSRRQQLWDAEPDTAAQPGAAATRRAASARTERASSCSDCAPGAASRKDILRPAKHYRRDAPLAHLTPAFRPYRAGDRAVLQPGDLI